jgi:folylpolyglutamate synthase/dihydropteroate synthase
MQTVQCALDELRKQRTYLDLLTDEAIAYVGRQLASQPNAHLRIVFGMVNDKDYQFALTDASEDDFVFVGGSCYVVADLLSAL